MELLKMEDYASSQVKDELIKDEQIVRRIVAGEKELFEILLRRYNQTLFRVIRSYLKSRNEVQDVMQDTYLKAFDKLYQFHFNAAFSTWLIRIGINEALLRLRNMKKERRLYADSSDVTSHAVTQISDKRMNPEKVFIRSEVQHLVENAIDGLPEKYRIVFVLREVDGLDSAAVADCLQISEGNVKVRLHRAKSLMKNALYQLSSGSTAFEFGNKNCDAIVNFVMRNI